MELLKVTAETVNVDNVDGLFVLFFGERALFTEFENFKATRHGDLTPRDHELFGRHLVRLLRRALKKGSGTNQPEQAEQFRLVQQKVLVRKVHKHKGRIKGIREKWVPAGSCRKEIYCKKIKPKTRFTGLWY